MYNLFSSRLQLLPPCEGGTRWVGQRAHFLQAGNFHQFFSQIFQVEVRSAAGEGVKFPSEVDILQICCQPFAPGFCTTSPGSVPVCTCTTCTCALLLRGSLYYFTCTYTCTTCTWTCALILQRLFALLRLHLHLHQLYLDLLLRRWYNFSCTGCFLWTFCTLVSRLFVL